MEAMEAILSRRSIRSYTSKHIPEKVIDELLEAAMSAPSASNRQTWHFIIITDREILDKIPAFHPDSKMLNHSRLAIAVCGDLQSDKGDGFWVQDCSAATQNMLLAAHAIGLGAVWLGIYPVKGLVEGIEKLLELPESITPLSLVSIGYPDEEKPRSNRYDSLKIHRNVW